MTLQLIRNPITSAAWAAAPLAALVTVQIRSAVRDRARVAMIKLIDHDKFFAIDSNRNLGVCEHIIPMAASLAPLFASGIIGCHRRRRVTSDGGDAARVRGLKGFERPRLSRRVTSHGSRGLQSLQGPEPQTADRRLSVCLSVWRPQGSLCEPAAGAACCK